CRTRNPAGGGLCNTCGRKLPLRGLQYAAATTATPKRRRTLAQRVVVGLAWLVLFALLAGGGFYLWQVVAEWPTTP
ncbi:MAG TPA: hypothetical protein VFT12_06320, partial [Thermoanaerobaculia bacterium]|nr:hypothetical protein [Thermoanaerobaculia bacterium]